MLWRPKLERGVALAAALTLASVAGEAPGQILLSDTTPFTNLDHSVDMTPLKTGAGIVVLDWNDDPYPDIVISGSITGPPVLYENLGGLSFLPVDGTVSGLGMYDGDVRGIQGADYDNDGDTDLMLLAWAEGGTTRLLRNAGGFFVDVTEDAGLDIQGRATNAAFADYDLDGDLDVWVSRYYSHPNLLYRNEGDGTFTDVTVEAGLWVDWDDAENQSFIALWFDIDRDGDVDLFQGNDRCYSGWDANKLFVNQGDGTFVEDAASWGLDECMDSMGAALADLNGDGFQDLFITNIYYGHFLWTGGCDQYTDITEQAGVLTFQWGWGVVFQDFDNDGWPDLYIGHENLGTGDSTNRVFWNKGDGTFEDISAEAYVGDAGETITVTHADFDLDGDLDLIVGDLGLSDEVKLVRNSTSAGAHLRVRLEGTVSNRDALGTWVDVLAGGRWQRRARYEASAYTSTSEPVLHFGLGDASIVDRVVVRWPSGQTTVLTDLEVDKELTFIEPMPDTPTPPGVAAPPMFPELCGDGVDNDCDGLTDEGGVPGTPCLVGEGDCQVIGAYECTADLLGVVCVATGASEAAPELCGDGADNDCDGLTDEGFGTVGAPCVAGSGACETAGVVACSADGSAATCVPVEPVGSPELCANGVDDDCDGLTDELDPQAVSCLTGLGACSAVGELVCLPGTQTMYCLAEQPSPAPEVCGDGVDNDCDGLTDEDTEGVLGLPCVSGLGACAVEGATVCGFAGEVVCNATAGLPGTGEPCNGVDDDCDGETDEGHPLGMPCTVGEGACGAPGAFACAPDGSGGVACVGGTGAPTDEACNGVDDDCDGLTDEGFSLGEACSAGVGACARPGVIVCVPGGLAACDAQPGEAAPFDACGDGLDDDCDGLTDEPQSPDSAVGGSCLAGEGICAVPGTLACPDGGGPTPACVTEAPLGTPTVERCGNFLDDDCDGQTDEGFPVGATCTVGMGACAQSGSLICDAEGLGVTCYVPGGVQLEERCGDGVDDDCDGETDEGFAVGLACAVGAGACRATGQLVCRDDGRGVRCDAQAGAPSAELAGTGVDEDCDGETDEADAVSPAGAPPDGGCAGGGSGDAPLPPWWGWAALLACAALRRRGAPSA